MRKRNKGEENYKLEHSFAKFRESKDGIVA